ncbi:MAG: hypothetical protein VB934_19315 [Polyangiaceae bacterium]
MSHLFIQRLVRPSLKRIVLPVLVLVFASGCASRTAPFDKLDKASITILKLQAQAPATAPATPAGALIPGLPPELQQLGIQVLQQMQAQGLIPPGLIPPGLLPAPGVSPHALPAPLFRNQWAVAGQQPVVDEATREKLLDLFGSGDSFNNQRYGCFSPTMAVSFQSPELPEPVDIVVSLPCNQVQGYGLQWPHPGAGLTGESHATLTGIYSRMFGPVPPAGPGGGMAPAPAPPSPYGQPMPVAPVVPAPVAPTPFPAAPVAPSAAPTMPPMAPAPVPGPRN